MSYARSGIGCLLSPFLMFAFYGSTAIVFFTLGVYPFIYVQDVLSANAYSSAPTCGDSWTKDCRSQTTAEVSNVRTADDQPEFDVLVGGNPISVTRDSGGYNPQNGDSVTLEMWRGRPVRVFGPGGAELTTSQYPEARLETDQAVLGIFAFVGIVCLALAVAVGWFGRRILFARLMGQSRRSIVLGFALVFAILVVALPAFGGQAYGWLPQGLAVGLLILLGVVIYAWLRRVRSARR